MDKYTHCSICGTVERWYQCNNSLFKDFWQEAQRKLTQRKRNAMRREVLAVLKKNSNKEGHMKLYEVAKHMDKRGFDLRLLGIVLNELLREGKLYFAKPWVVVGVTKVMAKHRAQQAKRCNDSGGLPREVPTDA